MNAIREVQRINEEELKRGIAGTRASWHSQYSNSAWVYVGNLDFELVEGDVICVLSQYGEIGKDSRTRNEMTMQRLKGIHLTNTNDVATTTTKDDFHLVRDEETGKSKGFAFCKYEDARSCILAVDNFCGVKLCGRSVRVDHVENYRLPKELQEKDEEEGVDVTAIGAAYQGKKLANEYSLENGVDLFAPKRQEEVETRETIEEEGEDYREAKQERKEKRRRKREEKSDRKRMREERRMRKEEERRERRAKRMRENSEDGNRGRGKSKKSESEYFE